MTTSSSFIDLPDDVLFNIFRFLRPPDILTVRKTCKRLEAATLEPHVWTTAYRTCNNDFLPVVSSPSQMVTSDLERLLLHTCQLETLWGNPAAPECFFKKTNTLDATQMGRIEVEGMEICYGRFLVVQGLHAMFVYDLDRETEVFRYTAFEDDELSWAYSRSEVVNLELDLFFPFAATPSEEANREPGMSMCKISPSGFVTIRDWPGQSVDASFFVGTEFVIIEEFDPAPIRLIHLASMKAYPMSSRYMDEINNYPSLTITAFVPGGYVLLCFTDEFEGSLRDHYFELYCLPDPALLPGGTALYPTHRGHYHHSEDHFESGRFLSSNVSTNGLTGSIYLVVHSFKNWRLCFLRVMLQEDGNLILRLDNTDLPEVFWETPSPSNSVTRVRDVAFMRDGHRLPGEEDWLLCDMHMDSEGEPCVRTSKVTIPAEPAYHVLCLDIFRGRLISAGYHKGDSSREEIRFLEIGCPNPVDGHPLSARVA